MILKLKSFPHKPIFHYAYSSWIKKIMTKTIDCFWDYDFVWLQHGLILKSSHCMTTLVFISQTGRPVYAKYNRTCVKQHRNKRSPCIKRPVVKVVNLFPIINHFNFTSIQWLPLLSGRAYLGVRPNGQFVLSSTYIGQSLKSEPLTKLRLRLIFGIKFNPCFSPKVNWMLIVFLSECF